MTHQHHQVPAPAVPRAAVAVWLCPACAGSGRAGDGARCYDCAGTCFALTEPDGCWGADKTRAPRPPALAPRACRDCAFRPGSPEHETGDHDSGRITADRPFWCHHGLLANDTGYHPAANLTDGTPLGALLCRGWWDAFHEPGGPYLLDPYREPAPRADPAPAWVSDALH